MKYQLKQHETKIIFLVMGLIWCLLFFSNVATSTTAYAQMSLNPNPPNNPVRLIFIHHSVGEYWLCDENVCDQGGGLGISLMNNNYYVSDTNYGWGTDNIGDRTDIGNWWEWFRGSNSSTYLNALYNEGDQHSTYSRLSTAPTGGNEIIMFKSCFPNSALEGNPSDPVPSIGTNPLRGEGSTSEYHTIANAKGIYIDLLEYFRTRTDKLFIVITAPPLRESDTNTSQAANARAFNNWLVNEWLTGYPYKNVAVFDFYNVLTSNNGNANTNDLGLETGNHHRWWNGAIQHTHPVASNTAAYPSDDSHPTRAGNLKATGEFVYLLNVAYNSFLATPSDGLWSIDEGNPGDSGRGFQVELRGNVMVFTYYGYNADGRAQWYLAAGNFANRSFSGSMWRYEGGTYLGGPYHAASPIESVGTVSITFSSSTKGTITLPNEQPKGISKYVWGSTPTIPNPPSNGLWSIDEGNPGDSGRGFQLELQDNVMVFTYYGYNADGTAQWYLAAGSFANGSFSALMYPYEGGTYLGGPYHAASPIESVGTVSITFSSSNKGTIILPNEQPKGISKFLW